MDRLDPANAIKLVLAGAVNLTPEGFHATEKGPTVKLDTQSNNIF